MKPTYRKLDNISKLYVKQASPFTVWQSLRPRLCDQWTNHMPCTIRIWAYAVCLDIMGHVKVWPMNERNAHSKKKIRLFLFLLQLLGSNRDWHSCLGKTVINSLIIRAKKKKIIPNLPCILLIKRFLPQNNFTVLPVEIGWLDTVLLEVNLQSESRFLSTLCILTFSATQFWRWNAALIARARSHASSRAPHTHTHKPLLLLSGSQFHNYVSSLSVWLPK